MAPVIAESSALLAFLASRFKLDDESRAFLCAAVRPVSIAKGELILRPGELCDSLWFLVDGAMRSHSTNEKGDEFTYFLFFESSFVTDYRSLVTREPSRFSIEAMEHCRLEVLRHRSLNAMLERYPEGLKIVRALDEAAYVELDRRTESLLFDSAADRYRRFLSEYSEQAGRVPQYVLASWLGIKPESLSRIRRKLGLGRPG
jgi:CRP-like cAMP-binding protein